MHRRVIPGLLLSAVLLAAATVLYARLFPAEATPERIPPPAAPVVPAIPAPAPAPEAAPPPALDHFLDVTSVAGVARRRHGRHTLPLAVGDRVETTDVISTANDASVEVRAEHSGVSVSVAASSRVRVVRLDDETADLTLLAGRAYATAPPGRRIRVSGGGDGAARAETTGGSFAIQAEPGGSVRVVSLENKVTLLARNQSVEMDTGQGAVAAPGRAPRRVRLPARLLLKVRWPGQSAQRETVLNVQGRTAPGAVVRSAGAHTYADSDGRFYLAIPLRKGQNRPRVTIEDLSGRRKAAVSPRPILVDNEAPIIEHDFVVYKRRRGPPGD